MAASTVTVAVVLAQQFPLLSLSSCLESIRVANRELGRIGFDWELVTPDDAPVMSSSGVPITPDLPLNDVSFADVVLVLSSYRPDEACTSSLLGWLRRQDRKGSVIGCVDTSAYILAKAKILGNHKVSVHRESLSAYRDLLSDSAVLDQMFAADDRIVSSAGGVATLDMMLALVSRFYGQSLSDRVASVLNYRRLAVGTTSVETSLDGMIARVEPRLARMIEIMYSNLDRPPDVAAICKMALVPPATANRLFLRYFRLSPSRYFTRLRLDRAQWLLGNSSLSVSEIAARIGFGDASAFTRAYRRQFGGSPSSLRQSDHAEPSVRGYPKRALSITL